MFLSIFAILEMIAIYKSRGRVPGKISGRTSEYSTLNAIRLHYSNKAHNIKVLMHNSHGIEMSTHVCCDREIPTVIKRLTAYQNPEPIHLRIITMHIKEFEVDNGKKFSDAILKLRTYKDATVSILVDRRWISKAKQANGGNTPPFIQNLENMGVRIMSVRGLHAKMIFLSSGKRKSLLIGSANLTPTAMHKHHEADIYLNNDNLHVIDEMNKYIINLFQNARPI